MEHRKSIYNDANKLIGQPGRTQNDPDGYLLGYSLPLPAVAKNLTWLDRRVDSQHKGRADNHPAPIVAYGAARKARKGGGLAGIRAVIVAVVLAAVLAQAPQARAQTPEQPEARELVVGTKVAPPFAMKAEDGTWRGISIDLWRRIADQMHLRYRFQETTLKGLTDGVAEGSLDAAVAALTVTGPRHRLVDFTQPFYSTGLGIAVVPDAGITWWPIISNVFSLGFLRAVAALFAISLAVGVVLWFVERPSVPMTMRHRPPASLGLGTGERHRGYAQFRWPYRHGERCRPEGRPQADDGAATVCRVARTLTTAPASDILGSSQAAHPGGDRPRRRYRRDRCHPAARRPLFVSPDRVAPPTGCRRVRGTQADTAWPQA